MHGQLPRHLRHWKVAEERRIAQERWQLIRSGRVVILIARRDLVAIGRYADVDDGRPVLLDEAAEVRQRRYRCWRDIGSGRRSGGDRGARLMEGNAVGAYHTDRERTGYGERNSRAAKSFLHRFLLEK